jgi:hypothetical protein
LLDESINTKPKPKDEEFLKRIYSDMQVLADESAPFLEWSFFVIRRSKENF